MERTVSATPLSTVQVEARPGGLVSDVWLRRGIEEDVVEDGDTSYPVWTADEEHMTVPGTPDAAEIESMFDQWWALAQGGDDPMNRRLEQCENALMELADLIGGM